MVYPFVKSSCEMIYLQCGKVLTVVDIIPIGNDVGLFVD